MLDGELPEVATHECDRRFRMEPTRFSLLGGALGAVGRAEPLDFVEVRRILLAGQRGRAFGAELRRLPQRERFNLRQPWRDRWVERRRS